MENSLNPVFPSKLPVSDFQAALDVDCPDFVLKVLVISTLFKNIDWMDGFLFKIFFNFLSSFCSHSSLFFAPLFYSHFLLPKISRKKKFPFFKTKKNSLRKSKGRNFLPAIILRKYKTGVSPSFQMLAWYYHKSQNMSTPCEVHKARFREKWYANKGEKNFYFLKKLIKKRKPNLPFLPNLFRPAFPIPA